MKDSEQLLMPECYLHDNRSYYNSVQSGTIFRFSGAFSKVWPIKFQNFITRTFSMKIIVIVLYF